MKIKINQNRLKKGINLVERISSRSTSLPILKNILIKIKKNFINLSTTDLEIGIKWWSLAKTENEGDVVIPSNIISGLINFLPEKQIELSSDNNNNLLIECDNFKTQIKGFNPDDFPIIPEVLEKEKIILNSDILCKSLSQIVDIPSFSATRPEISGIFFSFEKNELKIVATDSYRLGEKIVKLNKTLKNNISFILPQKAIKEIINIFSDRNKDINIIFSSNQILFEIIMEETSHPEIQFISRLIDGEYPNYKEIIPQKSSTQIILNKSEFLNQIKASSLFSGKINEVKLKINPEKNGLEISSKSIESGEFKSFISGKIKGKKEEVSFNYRFLMDGLLNIQNQEIIFETSGASSPGVLKPNKDLRDFIYIVMPIKSN
jgi:DNA polymerase III subunit beta